MSVTVADLLNLPSLRQAKVLGGRNGLGKIVSSISVLESVDPGILIDPLFPQGEFYGSEIVITGFLNCRDDVQRQCDNLRRLAQGGEVGLILYYVGIYMPKVDPKLIQLADELDFVLICMPEGEQALRYGEVINDVTACIFRDQAKQNSIVLDILERVSALPKHQQSVNTVMKMLSDRICATVILCDAAFHILNLVTWPRSTENRIKEEMERLRAFPSSGGEHRVSLCRGLPAVPQCHQDRQRANHGVIAAQSRLAIGSGRPFPNRGCNKDLHQHLGMQARGSGHPRTGASHFAGRAYEDVPPGGDLSHRYCRHP